MMERLISIKGRIGLQMEIRRPEPAVSEKAEAPLRGYTAQYFAQLAEYLLNKGV